jgi:uncharacterized protein YndB with AHSA1/START domain
MTMLEIILIVIAVAIVGVVVLAALQPSAFRVERSTLVKAAPERVFPLINDLHAFNTWNPFMKMEPDAKVAYSGAPEGKGAAYTWEGAKTGSGRMEITETAAPSKVRARLEFYKPFAATNVAEFTVEGRGGVSNVTWAMSGQKSFVPKLMGLFFSMDKMVGTSFEQGLAELKAKAEG